MLWRRSCTRPGRQSRRRPASDQETGCREASELISRSTRSRPSDAQTRPQRRDVVVGGPSSRVPTGFDARRSDACHRVGQIDCGRGHALVRDHHRPPIFREQHGDHVNPQVRFVPRIIRHQCGVLGCRVGEVSNPGPVVTRQGRRQAFHDTQIDVSSDEEPLVRPNMGRDVIARIEAGSRHCSSVPTTCGHIVQECADTIVDDLERDLTESQAQHAMP